MTAPRRVRLGERNRAPTRHLHQPPSLHDDRLPGRLKRARPRLYGSGCTSPSVASIRSA